MLTEGELSLYLTEVYLSRAAGKVKEAKGAAVGVFGGPWPAGNWEFGGLGLSPPIGWIADSSMPRRKISILLIMAMANTIFVKSIWKIDTQILTVGGKLARSS